MNVFFFKLCDSIFPSLFTFPTKKSPESEFRLVAKLYGIAGVCKIFQNATAWSSSGDILKKFFQIFIPEDVQDSTYTFRDFDREYRHIYKDDLEKIYDRTKCRKPCFYKKYSLIGEEQPSPIHNGHLLFSLTAMQDSIEVSNSRSCGKVLIHKSNLISRWRRSC